MANKVASKMANKILPPARIGFVGLGNMGFPMAGNLAKAGYQLLGNDQNSEQAQRFTSELGATIVNSLKELGEQCDVVITMLPEGNIVRAVLLGEGGVCSGLAPGKVVIDMSSCSPVDTRQLAKDLAALEIHLVDAPVSGGVVKAVDGSLAIMAGGDSELIDACLPLLEVMGKVFKTGGSGTGHAMKAINNYLSAATLAVTSEAVLAGEQFGLERETMVDIINAATGRSNSSEHKFPTFILNEKFNSGFFLGLMAKDLRFAKALTDSTDTPNTLLTEISRLWNEAEDELGFNADNTEIYRFLNKQIEK